MSRSRSRGSMVVLSMAAVLALIACRPAKEKTTTLTTPSPTKTTATGTEPEFGTTGPYAPKIDPARFTKEITNPFLPLKPGTRWVYEEREEGEKKKIVVEVTTETKTIMGVTCVVVRDTVTLNREVLEDTFDWYAQDDQGNVWYFGEDTKELEKGKVVSTKGSWEGGVNGAQPGIIMKGDPKAGDAYRQEFYAGEAEDIGEVLSLTEKVSVPFGSYEGVLKTRDFTPLEPDLEENKYYARGVGVVLEITTKGGSGRVELIEMTKTG